MIDGPRTGWPVCLKVAGRWTLVLSKRSTNRRFAAGFPANPAKSPPMPPAPGPRDPLRFPLSFRRALRIVPAMVSDACIPAAAFGRLGLGLALLLTRP
ncbi:MAG: hypothetical protein VYD87_15810 [Pseudomonadota bacterium]|nr:hypothetical protein [Pseudomonadota bacterium]